MVEKDFESIKSMLVQVINKQNDMDDTLREMDKTLTQVKQTVVGNPVYGQKGLVAEIEEIKDYVEKDKMIKNKIVGGLVIIGIVWTAAIEYFFNLFKR